MKGISTALSNHPLPYGAYKLLSMLDEMILGTLELTTPNGMRVELGDRNGVTADLQINDWSALKKIFRNGDIGLAECYRDRIIESNDVTKLVRLGIRNQAALDKAINGHPILQLGYWIKHLFRRNTRRGSRKNISAHYDLGNDFYSLWLDATMTYSSAYFDGDYSIDMVTAQNIKYQRMLDLTGAKAGDHVLEIGCGWGGFAEYASRKGIYVHGVTLSKEQLAYAHERIRKANLKHLPYLELKDYRDLQGRYDHVVSIEMLEAVGEKYWNRYFDKLRSLLKPGGKAAIQVITIRDDKFEAYRRRSDFIQQYIFPGGMLPSVEKLEELSDTTGLQMSSLDRFGKDYAETIRRWRHIFERKLRETRILGFDDEFIKLWRFYLCYCEAGFDEGEIDVVHLQLTNPGTTQ